MIKIKYLIISVMILCAGVSWPQNTVSMSPELQKIYRTLSLGQNYELKKDAVNSLNKMYDESKDMIYVDTAIDLLEHSYDPVAFNEEDQVMYYDDRIARELVKLVNKSRHPKAFVVLIQIVTKRNHTDDTIKAAWKAIRELDWSLAPGKY